MARIGSRDKQPLENKALEKRPSRNTTGSTASRSREGSRSRSAAPRRAATAEGREAPSLVVIIPATAEWVRVVRLAVAGAASRMAFSHEEVEDIKLAVAEACNNAILHCRPLPDDSRRACRSVRVELTPHPDRLEAVVHDEGRMEALPGLTSPPAPMTSGADGLHEGGLGLILMQSLMDEVEQREGPEGNTAIWMVKLVRRA